MLKTTSIGVKIGASLSPSFNSVLDTADSKVKKLGQTAFRLKPKIDASGAVIKYGKQLDIARRKQEKFAGSAPHLTSVIGKLEKKYASASKEARKLGMSVKGIHAEHATLKSRANYAIGAKNRLEGRIRNKNVRNELHGQTIGAVAGAMTIGLPIRQAIRFESQMSDIKKVVDFDSPEAFEKMRKDILKLSTVIPVGTEGLTSIIASAGQTGKFANKDLLPFAEMEAKVGVAFDITADQAGDSLVEIGNALGLTIKDTSLFADAINHLSNKTAAKAPKLLDFSQRIAADGDMFGYTATQVAAIGSAMLASGHRSEVAATSFRNMGKALTKGASATPNQIKAYKKLGIDYKKVSKDMQKDAIGTTMKVLKAFKKLKKDEVAATSNQLFGGEARAVNGLITKYELLEKSLDLVSDKSKYLGSTDKEYAVRAKTTANALITMNSHFNKLGVTIGTVFLPPLNEALEVIGNVVGKMSDFAEKHPETVKAIGSVVTALVGLKIGKIAFKYALTGISDLKLGALSLVANLGKAKTSLLGLTTRVFPALITGIRTVGIAFMTNPIGLVIGAISFGAFMIVRHWGKVSSFFSGFWQGVKPALQPMLDLFSGFGEILAPVGNAIGEVVNWFGELLSPVNDTKEGLNSAKKAGVVFGQVVGNVIGLLFNPIGTLKNHFEALGPVFDTVKNYAVTKFGEIITFIKSIPGEMLKVGANIIGSIIEGIESKWSKLTNKLHSIGQSIKNAFSFGDKKEVRLGLVGQSARVNLGSGMQNITAKDMASSSNVINLSDRVKKAGAGLALGTAIAMPVAASQEPANLIKQSPQFRENTQETIGANRQAQKVNNTFTIHQNITQKEGESLDELADRIVEKTVERMEEKQQDSIDGRLYD